MATRKQQSESTASQLRRMYIDCRYGQLHLTASYPSNGGFDEATPIIFLHAEDGTGADFNHCAALLGTDRSVYSPDLPGSGASDAPKGRMAVAGLALAIADLVEQFRLRRIDLIGCGRGALVAFQLATTHPQHVRRLIVAGPQQPSSGIPQPMFQFAPEPAPLLEDPPEAVVAALRGFLDRL